MLDAVVISNGIEGLERFFVSDDDIRYRFETVGPCFAPDLGGSDLLIVPNGSDHVAMLAIRRSVRAHLDAGGAVMCFDGWFTDWVPGNRWVMDNSKPTREVRYAVRDDWHSLFEGVELDALIYSHGISGWWACGYIEPAEGADVVLEDTWGRAMIVLDERSTPGTLFLTASGPLGDGSYDGRRSAIAVLYRNMLAHISRKRDRHEESSTAV